jgi:dimethylargininase
MVCLNFIVHTDCVGGIHPREMLYRKCSFPIRAFEIGLSDMFPKHAIVREPGKSFTKCLSCHPLRDTVSLPKAKSQHAIYRRTLSDLGLDVITIPPDDLHPDACFVEDNAVVHGKRALICRMGAESRRGEGGPVEKILSEYFAIQRASPPATVEGGDVVHLPSRLISGLSQRTNAEGIQQMSSWLGVKVDTIDDPSIMHLKSYVTSLSADTLIASRRFSKHPAFAGLKVITVPDEEAYAADTLTVDKTVLMPAGLPRSVLLVKAAGFDVVPVDVSEFEKCDGAVTCLSILF